MTGVAAPGPGFTIPEPDSAPAAGAGPAQPAVGDGQDEAAGLLDEGADEEGAADEVFEEAAEVDLGEIGGSHQGGLPLLTGGESD
jgi:hypothetical protein